jgi:hypothetical protein
MITNKLLSSKLTSQYKDSLIIDIIKDTGLINKKTLVLACGSTINEYKIRPRYKLIEFILGPDCPKPVKPHAGLSSIIANYTVEYSSTLLKLIKMLVNHYGLKIDQKSLIIASKKLKAYVQRYHKLDPDYKKIIIFLYNNASSRHKKLSRLTSSIIGLDLFKTISDNITNKDLDSIYNRYLDPFLEPTSMVQK